MGFRGFRHIGLKILSLALAALLWLVVAGEQIVERALRIPLEFTNLPPQLELVGEPPTVVDVRVRGSSGALSRVAAGELVAVLDLRTARAGQRLFHLTGADVRAPFGIEVVQLSPSNVSVAFEPSATKVVPVVPGVEGEPADGYVAGIVKSDPATVEVVGPTGAVARLTAAITEPVSIAGAKGPVTDMVNIGVADPTVRLVEPGSAEVTVNIVGAPVEWAIAGIPIRKPEQGSFELLPADVTVFVRGPRETRGSRVDDFEATIDTEGLRPGVFQLPVKVIPPARVGIIKIEPPHVRVRIRE
jgi:YbbR domain-containing protein